METEYWQRVYHNIQRRVRRRILLLQLMIVVLGISLGIAIRQEYIEIGMAFMGTTVGVGILSGFLLRFAYLRGDPLILTGTVTTMQWLPGHPPIIWVELDIRDAFYVDANGHIRDSKWRGRQRIGTNMRVYSNLAVGRRARLVCTPGGRAVYLLEEVER